jgi:hypothetical protein
VDAVEVTGFPEVDVGRNEEIRPSLPELGLVGGVESGGVDCLPLVWLLPGTDLLGMTFFDSWPLVRKMAAPIVAEARMR